MSETTKRTYPHGTAVEPLYTSGPQNNPGFRAQPWWTMVQEHLVEKEFAANDWALERLGHGASGPALLPHRRALLAAHFKRH
jgi:hypothetical protein